MTHFLQSVLVKKDEGPLFNAGITQLEKATGHSGVDTRLIGDIIEKAHVAMRQLGLDPSDTTGIELYNALKASVRRGISEPILIDTDYVLLLVDSKIISFNLIDVIENSHHELKFNQQIISHGQRSLRGEIVGRYVDHGRTDKATTHGIASSIGLLQGRGTWFDAWYTEYKHQRKQKIKHTREKHK